MTIGRACSSATRRLRVVGVAVNDLPFAVLSAVDMRDTDRDRLDRATGDGCPKTLETPRISHVTADLNDLDVEPKVAHIRESRRDPGKRLAQLVPARLAHADRPEQGHRISPRPQLHAWFGVSVHERLLGLGLGHEHRSAELLHLVHVAADSTTGAAGGASRPVLLSLSPCANSTTPPQSDAYPPLHHS